MTAVEWLFSQLPDHLRLSRDGFDMFQQAKELERKQIIEAVMQTHPMSRVGLTEEQANDYYTQTYKNDKQ